MHSEVVIIGAGPTGLMLANQLARRGIKPMIIDRHSGPAQQTRAMAVHARTLEIYSKLGIADEALSRGARGTGANMWTNGRWTARVPLGDIGAGVSPYPFVLALGQDENEHILGEHLTALGVHVQWRTELIALRQTPNHVELTLKLPDGTRREIRANWTAGCDGSRSPVREMCGIGFPGAPYEHTFFVADTEATGPMRPSELNIYLWRDGFHLFFPMPGHDRWRVIGILPKEFRNHDDISFDALAPSIKHEAGTTLEFKSCSWFSTYRIYHRAAERFRSERCFLLGDAAHVHSPMGGQGMNTGLQDAYNLAWKLALVINGEADAKLLDTYEQERMPVARRLLETTDRAFQLLVADNWFARLVRTRIIGRIAARAMTFERVRKLAFRTVSQTGIAYPNSSLSEHLGGLPASAPNAGDRFPWLKLQFEADGEVGDLYQYLDDTKFTLLVFGHVPVAAEVRDDHDGLLQVRIVPATPINDAELERAMVPRRSCYLLRPDGHVALCGNFLNVTTIDRYFIDRVKVGAASRLLSKSGQRRQDAVAKPV